MKNVLIITMALVTWASPSWGQEKRGFDCVAYEQGITLEWRYSTVGESKVDVKIIMDGDTFEFNQDEITLDPEQVESFLFKMKNAKEQGAVFSILEMSQDRETPSKAELTVDDGKMILAQDVQLSCGQAK